MRNKTGVAFEDPIVGDRCRHYWIIESPNGPTSMGVCKFCHEGKEFDNYWPDLRWEGDMNFLLETLGLGDTGPEREPDDS
jgi:hypothetical protein